MHDDLPGHYLDLYSGPSDDPEKFVQKTRHTAAHKNRSYHFILYMSNPAQIFAGETHSIHFLVKGFSTVPSRTEFKLREYNYELRITRETAPESLLRFKVFRGATEVTDLEEVYKDSDGAVNNYLYISFNLAAGVIYYKGTVDVRIKVYETFNFKKVNGANKLKHATYEVDGKEEEIYVSADNQVSYIYFKAEFKASAGVTSNKAGFRVTLVTSTEGAFPAFLVSTRDTSTKTPLCFFSLYGNNQCLSMAMLHGPDDTIVEKVMHQAKPLLAGPPYQNSCKAATNHHDCVIPKPGNIVNLEPNLPKRLRYTAMPIANYDAHTQDDKDYLVEFTSNLGTRYLISCPHSCKLKKLQLSKLLFFITINFY